MFACFETHKTVILVTDGISDQKNAKLYTVPPGENIDFAIVQVIVIANKKTRCPQTFCI